MLVAYQAENRPASQILVTKLVYVKTMTTQLRRYEIEPEKMSDFIEWFQRLVPIRATHGLSLDWAYADRENDLFVWSTTYEGSEAEFKSVEEAYNASPERSVVYQDYQKQVVKMTVSFVEVLDL